MMKLYICDWQTCSYNILAVLCCELTWDLNFLLPYNREINNREIGSTNNWIQEPVISFAELHNGFSNFITQQYFPFLTFLFLSDVMPWASCIVLTPHHNKCSCYHPPKYLLSRSLLHRHQTLTRVPAQPLSLWPSFPFSFHRLLLFPYQWKFPLFSHFLLACITVPSASASN